MGTCLPCGWLILSCGWLMVTVCLNAQSALILSAAVEGCRYATWRCRDEQTPDCRYEGASQKKAARNDQRRNRCMPCRGRQFWPSTRFLSAHPACRCHREGQQMHPPDPPSEPCAGACCRHPC